MTTDAAPRTEWRGLPLGEACTKIGSGATPRGGKDSYLESGPYALIRSQNVYNDGFRHGGLAFIDDAQAEALRNVEVETEDVLLNITGDSVARVCQVDAGLLPARVNQHVAIIRPDPAVLDARFLRYYLASPEVQAMLLSWAGSGGTRNALTKKMIESIEVRAPSDVREQRAIAHVLGTLDDKIELNRRMNETLEAMARALFRSWFVDFDPVRAKMEGRWRPGEFLPGLPAHLHPLFPDRLVPSELGDIPEGWEVRGLDGIADFTNGLALQRFPPEGEDWLPVIKIAEMRRGYTDKTGQASANLDPRYIVEDGDVLFSWSGSLELVLWSHGRGALNQHLFKVTSGEFPQWFYWGWLHEHLDDFRGIAADKATTMGHIQLHHLTDARVAVPPKEVLKAADGTLGSLLQQQVALAVQSRDFATLRDTLLPRLVSGELPVQAV
ncbi:MAG: restriction endonuclease subunit S [Chloroflexota bacterium]|nr:restriction endonuclease subunit S [Chloroflexota bacterium]